MKCNSVVILPATQQRQKPVRREAKNYSIHKTRIQRKRNFLANALHCHNRKSNHLLYHSTLPSFVVLYVFSDQGFYEVEKHQKTEACF